MTARKARQIAKASMALVYDGKRGRPKDWTPRWLVYMGAGASAVLIAKEMRDSAIDVIQSLLLGERPRKLRAYR